MNVTTATADLQQASLAQCIVPLAHPLPLARCGGKAWHLRRMLDLGLPVPDGLVITSEALETFLDRNSLRRSIDALLENCVWSDFASQSAASHSVGNLIAQGTIPPEILELLSESLLQLAPGSVVVRSSAIGEDSAQHSFAGQLDSLLHVPRDVESVGIALKKCWASFWSPRATAYQRTRRCRLAGLAVIIQEQVPAALSGVLFTRRPDAPPHHPGQDWMLLEYCGGLADRLVSGDASPGRVLISRATREVRSEARVESPTMLDEVAALTLANCGLALEDAFGGPQDIEWSFDSGGQLFLLQSRPITAWTAARARLDHQSERLVVWSNANVNENFPDPISPLLYSIAALGYYHYFRNLGMALGISRRRIEAMEQPLRNLVGVHGARLYYNLTNIHAVLRMAPLGEFLADSFNQFVGTSHTHPAGGDLTWTGFSPGRVGQWLEIVRIAAASLSQLAFVARRVAIFERTVDDFAAATTPQALATAPPRVLLDHLRRFFDIRCHQWLGASLADAAAMLSYSLLKRLLDAELSGQEGAIAHNSLLRGLCGVVSCAPANRLWELSRQIRSDRRLRELFAQEADAEVLRQLNLRAEFTAFREGVQQYLADWGFRCSGELMLTVPSWQERPEGVIEILRTYAAAEGESPGERLDRQQAEREHQTSRLVKVLRERPLARFLPWPTKAFVFRRLLRWTQKSIVLRERARLKQALLYSRCRRIALAIGSRLVSIGTFGQADDVFFLTAGELEALLSGQSMFPAHTRHLVALRRSAHAELSRQQPPDTFSLPEGACWQPDDALAGQSCPLGANGERFLHGSGVCGGVATGPAAVLDSASQLDELSAGRILVTRQTDPGWAPVFPLIQGLVMERGGMLSHGAILAREYGLPTVVGIADATKRIASGQFVTVDGDRALVELS